MLLFNSPIDPSMEHARGLENESRFWELSKKLAGQVFI
jgi:hypothetical protein